MSTFDYSFQNCTGGSSQWDKLPIPPKKQTHILIGKKELKLSLFTDDVILYGEIPKK